MIMMSFRRAVKGLFFLMIFIVTFVFVSNVTMGFQGTDFQQSAGFFNEPNNSLDAVYIGASPTFTSWAAPVAWKKYGIAMRTFANNSQPLVAVESFLKMARKTQPAAVYLIAINGFYDADELPVADLHFSVDYFPLSIEKFKLTAQLCENFKSTPEECIELFFPLVRYHAGWSKLQTSSFHMTFDPYKGGARYSAFLSDSEDISLRKPPLQGEAELPKFTQDALDHLLNYCKEEDVQVVFVLSAQYRWDANDILFYNTIMEEIRTFGFPLINELEDFELIGLDDTTDFYNVNHTNIHGALKITDYLSQYLLAHYDFPEKAGGYYDSWDEAYDRYKEIIAPYLTEEELSQLP